MVNTGSSAGIYGSGTNLDYTAAKGAILCTIGLAATSHGSVQVNAIAPGGFTPMIEDRFPDEPLRSVVQNDLRSELVSPLVAWLVHEDCAAHGQVFEGPRQGSLRGLQGFWARDMTPASLTATGTRSTILTA